MSFVVPQEEVVLVRKLRELSLNRDILLELFPNQVVRVDPQKLKTYEAAMVVSAYLTWCCRVYKPVFTQMPVQALVEILPELTSPSGPHSEAVVLAGLFQLRELGYARVIEFVGTQYLEPSLVFWHLAMGVQVTESLRPQAQQRS